MARIVHVKPDGVVVGLTGWTALAALKARSACPDAGDPVDLDRTPGRGPSCRSTTVTGW